MALRHRELKNRSNNIAVWVLQGAVFVENIFVTIHVSALDHAVFRTMANVTVFIRGGPGFTFCFIGYENVLLSMIFTETQDYQLCVDEKIKIQEFYQSVRIDDDDGNGEALGYGALRNLP